MATGTVTLETRQAMAYDDNNIFAKILRGEIPSHKIYEDDRTLAFLDVMPRTPGHVLLIPKVEATDLLDIPPDDLNHLMATVRKLAPLVVEAMGADGFLVQQFNGAAAGQTVFHIHIHLIPRTDGQSMKPHGTTMEDQAVLAANAAKIRAVVEAKLG
jgi:histidine triad (HIT) family protein